MSPSLPRAKAVRRQDKTDKQDNFWVARRARNVLQYSRTACKTGARALRSIVEELMLDIMYDIPSDDSIKRFVITKEMVESVNEGANGGTESSSADLIHMPQKNQAESA